MTFLFMPVSQPPFNCNPFSLTDSGRNLIPLSELFLSLPPARRLEPLADFRSRPIPLFCPTRPLTNDRCESLSFQPSNMSGQKGEIETEGEYPFSPSADSPENRPMIFANSGVPSPVLRTCYFFWCLFFERRLPPPSQVLQCSANLSIFLAVFPTITTRKPLFSHAVAMRLADSSLRLDFLRSGTQHFACPPFNSSLFAFAESDAYYYPNFGLLPKFYFYYLCLIELRACPLLSRGIEVLILM